MTWDNFLRDRLGYFCSSKLLNINSETFLGQLKGKDDSEFLLLPCNNKNVGDSDNDSDINLEMIVIQMIASLNYYDFILKTQLIAIMIVIVL